MDYKKFVLKTYLAKMYSEKVLYTFQKAYYENFVLKNLLYILFLKNIIIKILFLLKKYV